MTKVSPAWALLAAALTASSCGYIADPLPPSLNIPLAVGDLTATQRGEKIELRFTLPRTNSDGLLIKKFDEVRAEVGPDMSPFNFDKWFAGAAPTQIDVSGTDQTSLIATALDAKPWAGKRIAIVVRSSAHQDRWSPFSNVVHLTVVAPLEPPKIEVTASSKGYVIAWTPQRAGLRFRILRRSTAFQKDPIEVATTDTPPFIDRSSQFDTPYEYTVVAMDATEGASSESAPSEPVAVNVPDTFPPEVPGSITALAGTGTVEVTWERSPDADLKGYLLFRATGDGPLQQIGDLLTTPAYSDHDVQPGKRYRYAVAAVDMKGNTSEKSAPTEVDLQ